MLFCQSLVATKRLSKVSARCKSTNELALHHLHQVSILDGIELGDGCVNLEHMFRRILHGT